jgi:hypothetical protein
MQELFVEGSMVRFISGDNFSDVNPAVLIFEKDGCFV